MFLRAQAEEEEEEEQRFWYKSERCCDGCGEHFTHTDEVFTLTVVEATVEDGQFYMDVLHDDEGDEMFPPYLMHLECWEEVTALIDMAMADFPPMEAEDPIVRCSRCQSEIGKFEPFISSQFGEIQASKRQPSGKPTSQFEGLGTASPVCLICMAHVVEDHFEEWMDLIEMVPEEDEEEEAGAEG